LLSIYHTTVILRSNLRPTTRECVHLLTRGHFQSHDKDISHTTGSAIPQNPMLPASWLCFIGPALSLIEVLHCGNCGPWPWPDDLHIRTWLVFLGDIADVQIWTSYRPRPYIHQGFRKLSSRSDRQPKL